MALPEFELPDPDKEDIAAEDEKFEVEIEDDTPPEDRRRKPMKEPVEDPTEDELASYDEKVQARIKKFTRGYHDERRAKEEAFREREAAETFAKQVFEENKSPFSASMLWATRITASDGIFRITSPVCVLVTTITGPLTESSWLNPNCCLLSAICLLSWAKASFSSFCFWAGSLATGAEFLICTFGAPSGFAGKLDAAGEIPLTPLVISKAIAIPPSTKKH